MTTPVSPVAARLLTLLRRRQLECQREMLGLLHVGMATYRTAEGQEALWSVVNSLSDLADRTGTDAIWSNRISELLRLHNPEPAVGDLPLCEASELHDALAERLRQ